MRNKKLSPEGYLIAVLCAVALGVTGWMYVVNANRSLPVSNTEEVLETMAAAPTTEATVPPTTAPAPPAETKAKVFRTEAPVKGDTITEYAMDCLSYNETTRDWRVHNGIDLAAEEGTEVTAAAEGTVQSVYEDDNLGYTVVISHAGGYTTQYSNLADSPCVTPGQKVSLGQTLGTVGSSALLETAMGSHVHFAVTYHNSPMQPEEFLALG